MSKFTGREDTGYLAIRRELRRWIRQLPQNERGRKVSHSLIELINYNMTVGDSQVIVIVLEGPPEDAGNRLKERRFG